MKAGRAGALTMFPEVPRDEILGLGGVPSDGTTGRVDNRLRATEARTRTGPATAEGLSHEEGTPSSA
jgi:hypothetical protein